MTRGRGRKSLYIVGVVALLARSSVAPAQTPPSAPSGSEAKKACLAQHEAAQTSRRTGKLLEARDAALVCSREECPAVVRADCGEWLDSVTKTIPSLVISVKSDGKDVFDVRVSIDGKIITSHLDGTPLELNPGQHTFRFEYSTFDPIVQEILVLEGEKNRVVAANFVKSGPVAKEQPRQPEQDLPAPIAMYRPTPTLTYVLGGVAVAGVAGFAAFGLTGQAKKKDLESSCRPVCTDEQLKPVQTQFILADASLGIAIVSVVTAGIVYFTRPSVPLPGGTSQGKAARPAAPMVFGFSPTATGAQFAMQKEFRGVGSLKYVFLGVPLLVGFSAFSACSFTVDLDYLQDRQCPTNQKLCNNKCVSSTNPQTGCAAESCVPCTLAQATANCKNGLCAVSACLRSYQDCNHLPDDGCEIDVDHDPDHCGKCTAPPCVVANGTPDCAAGRCAIRSCHDGYGDCNQTADDGCETNLSTTSAHCSKCNTPCPSGAACVGGKCQ